MAYGLGFALIDGVLGAAAGAGQGVADEALLQQKQQVETLRDQRLSQLRQQEHAADTQSDIAARQANIDQQAAKNAAFYKSTADSIPTTPISNTASATYTDDSGQSQTDTSNTVTAQESPSRRDLADYRAEQAKLAGRPDLIAQTFSEDKDVRAQEAQDRANTIAASRDSNAQRRLDIQQQNADTQQQKLDALLGNDGQKPAKIREIEALTEMFGGDRDRALAVAFGARDKPRSDAVAAMAKIYISADPSIKPDDAIKQAEKTVDTLRSKDTPTKGGTQMKTTGLIDTASDDGSQITSDIAAQANADGVTGGTSATAANAPPQVVSMPNNKGTAKFTGRYSSAGKPIYQDGKGNLFTGN